MQSNTTKKRKEKKSKKRKRKTTTLVLTYAQVAFIAFRQMLFARHLEYKMHDLTKSLLTNPKIDASKDIEGAASGTPSESDVPLIDTHGARDDDPQRTSTSLDRTNVWTRVHSHFALMGGFVFEAKRMHATIMNPGQERLTLTPVALRKLAVNAPALLPDLSRESIRDKSKANGLAKFLVCVQAIWFIAQTIGRLATDLPISLLEMNTLLHAFCCLFIYLAWWHKPLDIEEPHVINIASDYAGKVCAWMMVKDQQHKFLFSFTDGGTFKPSATPHRRLRLAYEDDLESINDPEMRKQIAMSREGNKRLGRLEELTQSDYTSAEMRVKNSIGEYCVKLYTGQKVHGFIVYDIHATNESADPNAYTFPSLAFLERLRLAHSLRQEDKIANAWHFGDQTNLVRTEGKMLTKGTSIANLSSPDKALKHWRRSKALSPDSVLFTGLLLAGSLYGGIHLFAWNGPFPSGTERLLWRISCLVITSPVALVLLALAAAGVAIVIYVVVSVIDDCVPIKRLIAWFYAPIHNCLETETGDMVFWTLFFSICGILALVYAAARTYLVVECFINIAHLPDAVFQEPDWSLYIPHVGAG
jgi:hypothetical protein